MVEPISTSALIATTLAGILKGAGDAYSGSQSLKATKMGAKENKRRTRSDFYSQALNREADMRKFGLEQENNLASRRSSALQEAANGFIRALSGR